MNARTRTIARRASMFLALSFACSVRADEWPQWMGPGRDNVWRETGLVDTLAGGVKTAWKVPVAGGYAGPAVVGEHVFVADYVTSANVKVDNFNRAAFSGTERVLCLKDSDGSVVWKHEYPVKYEISYPAGPRCTPVVHEGKVYTLGAEGHLFCFEAATGKIVWSKELKQIGQTKSALWGYSAHPLIEGDALITLVGGEGRHVMAFHKNSGEELWRSQTQPEQGYVPPSILTSGDKRVLMTAGPAGLNALDPVSGKRLWTAKYEGDNGSIIHTPVRVGKYLFQGGYKSRNLLLELPDAEGPVKTVWKDKKGFGLSPVNVQPMEIDGIVVGMDQDGELIGVEIPSGKRLWTSTGPIDGGRRQGSATAFIVRQGERFWLFNELGDLIIANISKTGYKEQSRTKIIEPSNFAFGREVVWCMPAFAHKRVYVRNDSTCLAVDLAK